MWLWMTWNGLDWIGGEGGVGEYKVIVDLVVLIFGEPVRFFFVCLLVLRDF